MILLNQAASQMSNRILDKLIGNRFQQTILGFYIGTIVYALFLLSTIRDINSGIYVPAISTYLLIAFTVIDIFLFIYFLHYVTQSVKYETIIQKIYDTTRRSLEHSCFQKANTDAESTHDNGGTVINAYKSGIFQGFLHDALLSLCTKEKLAVSFLYPVGSSVIQNTPFLRIRSQNDLSEDTLDDLNSMINIHRGQDIGAYYYYGFRQLTEVAVKALSPGINDPGTAILSLQALSCLFAFRLQNFPVTQFRDEKEVPRILIKERSFSEIFKDCIYPIWDYGKNDRLLNSELHHTLIQLTALDDLPVMSKLLTLVQNAIKAQNKA